MRVLSLFSGIGGIDFVATWAGMETVAFCEIDTFCQQVLNKHWPQVPIYEDVRAITKQQLEKDGVINDTRAIDIVVGGFPCQPFSVAGQQRGKEDDRHLWPEMFRVIQELRPTWVLGENVTGLVRLGLDDVIADLESEGYTCRTFIIPASSVGAPHRRDRVFIVAHADSKRWEQGTQEPRVLQEMQENESNINQPKRSGETLAHSNSSGQQECNITPITKGQRFDPWQTSRSEANGSVKSRMGRVLDGISTRLDRYKWPAFLGQEQHQWEPPRVATGVKDRKNRLKALGNAVVPQQCYPILQAIMDANGGMENG